MRSILSGGKACLFLLVFTCFSCGGGGGGGAVTTLSQLRAEIVIPNPGESATVLIKVMSDGGLEWSAAVPTDLVSVVTGLTLNLKSDASLVEDLLGSGSFNPTTGAASGTGQVSSAVAAAIAANPGDYLATLLTSTKPPATGGFADFAAVEWHAVLLGTNESPVANPNARGAASFHVLSPTQIQFVIAMLLPDQASVTLAHIHVGPPGTNGAVVVDLEPANATRDPALGTITGTVTVDPETLARILADFEGFYCNVHTAAAPTGVARGQLAMGTVEMSVSALGSAEIPTVVETDARGGATFEFESFTTGHVILSLHSAVENVDNIILAHIHVGDGTTAGPILIDLMGPDFSAGVTSRSAESTISYTQSDFTRILANPRGFYCNIHTTAAPGGLVRGQLSMEPRTIFASLTGAEVFPTPVGGTSGTLRITFTGTHSCSYTLKMTSPAAALVTQTHVHDGPTLQNGILLVDLFLSGDMAFSGSTTITGTAEVPGRTFARILAGTPGGSALSAGLPSIFYGEVHSALNPNGAARGQFSQISGDTPPSNLAYSTPVTYLTGAPIPPSVPTSDGGAITQYTVSPPLPAGLVLNPTTGIISGTPTVTQDPTNYTVTGSSSAGSTQAIVNIDINIGPPLSLGYLSPVTYVAGTAITPNQPFSTGGQITNYAVTPGLPANLTLDQNTGFITGTPAAAQQQITYTVTGSNTAGQVQAQVKITITLGLQPPSGLSYTTPNDYPTGFAITDNVPTVGGGAVATWSINKALPTGLTFDTSNGKITGTPTVATAADDYTVTAANAAGSTQATVNIKVSLGKPGPFSYSPSTGLGYTTPPYAIGTMTPTHTGGGDPTTYSYTISPNLPNGITINQSTGVISGTPTQTSASTTYTITCTNSTGSTTNSGTVTISVPY